MATSPLFGWQEPDDTSLVKDGAAAIRTLGNAIDTSMGDLLGGTTGQVLAKASNTNMDFTWVAQDDSNAIQNAIVDAKGDLIAASANDTPARLAVGANGETLVADSSTSTGLRWQVPVNVNPVLNSAAQVWQRGTSIAFNASVGYFADQWYGYCVPAGTFSRQATNDTTNLPFIQYCMRIQRNSGSTNTGSIRISQSFETINSVPYAGKTVTMSFYARKGANYSQASSNLTFTLATGTGTDQKVESGYTGVAYPLSGTPTLTTTWQRFTYTGTIASTATELGFYFSYDGTGTAGAADYFEVTGVQLEVGSVATPFKTYAGTIQGELAACQRYYYRNSSVDTNTVFGTGWGWSGTAATVLLYTKSTLRTKPSAIDYSGINLQALPGGTTYSITSWTLDTGLLGTDTIATLANVSSGLTASLNYRLIGTSSSAYVGLSAEL